MNGQLWVFLGAILAGAGVAAGAIGSHLLKGKLEPQQLETYDIAVRYQMYHALALVVLGLLVARTPSGLATAAGICFALGIVLFSGGIYAYLATGVKPFVHIVPIGGVTWIIGWALLAVSALRNSAS